MKKGFRPEQAARSRQVVSEDVLGSLLGLIQRKFYEGHPVEFAKDSVRLQRWVVYWPARYWFDPRQVTVPNHRYLEILTAVLIDAAACQRVAKVDYPPAYLRMVIQSHFAMHGEEYYAAAKAARSLADHALATLGKVPTKVQDDVVARFTAADRLLEVSKRSAKEAVRATKKRAVNDQLSLL